MPNTNPKYEIPIKPENAILVFFLEWSVYPDKAFICQTGNLHDIPENFESWNRIEKYVCFMTDKLFWQEYEVMEFSVIDFNFSILDVESWKPTKRDKLNEKQKENLEKTIQFLNSK
jgi:hypothetical protein